LRKIQNSSGVVIDRRLHVRDLARDQAEDFVRKFRSLRTFGIAGGGGGSKRNSFCRPSRYCSGEEFGFVKEKAIHK
jgi:hypothetical protein